MCSGRGAEVFLGLLLRMGLALSYEMVPSALHLPPTGIPKLSVANLVEVKSTLCARSGGRSPEGAALGRVGVGGSESRIQSES